MVVARGLWGINVVTLGAVELNHGLARHIAQTNGQHWLKQNKWEVLKKYK